MRFGFVSANVRVLVLVCRNWFRLGLSVLAFLVLLAAGSRWGLAQPARPPLPPREVLEPVVRHWEPVPKEDWTQLLLTIAKSSANNFAKFKTWQATYRFQDNQRIANPTSGTLPGGAPFGGVRVRVKGELVVTVYGIVVFDADMAGGRLRTRYSVTGTDFRDVVSPTQVLRIPKQEVPPDVQGFEQVSLVLPDGYIYLRPKIEYGLLEGLEHWGPRRGRIAFKDALDAATEQRWGIVVNPVEWFKTGGKYWWEVCQQLAEANEKLGDAKELVGKVPDDWLTIEQSEEKGELRYRVTLRGRLGSEKGASVETQYEFSRQVGFNLVEYKQGRRGGPATLVKGWEYVEQDGVWVPKKVVHTNISQDGKKITFQRILELESCRLNAPIPESTFTLAGLGLKPGERFVDRVAGVAYIWDGNQLTEKQIIGAPVD
ncbi:MAG: hypothetical protein H5T92_00680 [Synergistales bacterium]|nr:hypothetical protein [Synergistales bacterium]